MINIITKVNCKISSIKVQRLIFFLIEKSFLILGTKIEPVLYRNQCEQMARLFDHFWPFMTTKFFSNYNQIAKEVLKFCPIQNKPLNKYQRLLNCCQSGEMLQNLVTLILQLFVWGKKGLSFFQISLSLETSLESWMTSSLVCFYRLSNDTSTAKFIDDKATLIDAKNVNCGTVKNLPGNVYQVGLVLAPQIKSIS